MSAARGPALIELDPQSSEPQKPHGIITVDCSSPYEYDDGISVTALPDEAETYRVNVFVADTSSLYPDKAITDRLLAAPEAKYGTLPNGKPFYEPMLDIEDVRRFQFVQGAVRSALVVSFAIGADQPPTDVEVAYGQVEITKNLNFRKFADRCSGTDAEFVQYGRAAAMIQRHLEQDNRGLARVYKNLVNDTRFSFGFRGAQINRLFMVAACHLAGQVVAEEDRLAIYRTQEPSYANDAGQSIARYSTTPNIHTGLGLTPYTRITSPLRRAEDFVMHGLLRARHDGRELEEYDRQLVEATVTSLNERVAAKQRLLGARVTAGALEAVS